LAAVLLGIFMLDLLLGSVPIPPAHTISALMGKLGNPLEHSIILGYRLPKALTALLAGAGLGGAGRALEVTHEGIGAMDPRGKAVFYAATAWR